MSGRDDVRDDASGSVGNVTRPQSSDAAAPAAPSSAQDAPPRAPVPERADESGASRAGARTRRRAVAPAGRAPSCALETTPPQSRVERAAQGRAPGPAGDAPTGEEGEGIARTRTPRVRRGVRPIASDLSCRQLPSPADSIDPLLAVSRQLAHVAELVSDLSPVVASACLTDLRIAAYPERAGELRARADLLDAVAGMPEEMLTLVDAALKARAAEELPEPSAPSAAPVACSRVDEPSARPDLATRRTEFGRALRAARERLGLHRPAAAAECGLSCKTYQAVERGVESLRGAALVRARAFVQRAEQAVDVELPADLGAAFAAASARTGVSLWRMAGLLGVSHGTLTGWFRRGLPPAARRRHGERIAQLLAGEIDASDSAAAPSAPPEGATPGGSLRAQLDAVRIARGWTWRDLAGELHVLPSVLHRWLSGKSAPSSRHQAAIDALLRKHASARGGAA